MSAPAEAIAAAVEAAVAHHRAGRLDQAEQGYRAALALDPGNLRAAYNLGLVLVRRKAFDAGLALLAEAVGKAPPDFPAWSGYAEGLIAAGRFAQADAVLSPHLAEPRARPLELRLRQAWGLALLEADDKPAAVAQLARAAALSPDDPDAHADLGLALLRDSQAEAAVAAFQHALALDPGRVGARVNLGSALKVLGRLDAAEAAYREALAHEPGHAAAVRNLNGLLVEQGRFKEALALADEGLARGGLPGAFLLARGVALHSLGRFEEAVGCFEALLAVEGVRYEALTLLALAQSKLGRHEAALATLDRAIAEDPANPLAYYRRGFIRLLLRDFAGGWADYEKRLDVDEFLPWAGVLTPEARRHLAVDATPGELAGKRVLLVAEQGIGDQVMFASILPDLLGVARSVTFACADRLVRLFSNAFPQASLLPVPGSTAQVADHDVVVAMGSLGRIWRNRPQDFPARPYLAPRPAVRQRWAARLGPRPAGLRIGLSWKGGTPRTGAERRSLTLDSFAPLLALPGCDFVSLQYGEVEAEVAEANARLGAAVRLFPAAEIDDFEDLAALVQELDVVVSVQTALVHLCGAVGQECLTLVPRNPEWRYTLTGSTMPWYGSVRIFRQPDAGVWEPVVEEVADLLRGRLSADRRSET